MLAQQRRSAILDLVRRTGGVRVSHLVRQFGVSEMTVRRDLEALAGRGLVAKVHGGATVLTGGVGEPHRNGSQLIRQRAEKAAIAARAARLAEPGSVVALSAGTTTAALATHLVHVPGLTVVTNSIRVAEIFHRGDHADQTVILTGGLRTRSDALVGPVAEAAITALNVDLLFLGVHGLSPRAGLTAANLLEGGVDRLLAAAARRIVVLADHTKWNTVGIATIAPLSAADVLVSDDGLPDDAYPALIGQVGELVVAEPVRASA